MKDDLKGILKLFVTSVAGVIALLVAGFGGAAICVVGYAALKALGDMLFGGAL